MSRLFTVLGASPLADAYAIPPDVNFTQSGAALWIWGNNGQGRLGTNSTTYFSSPVQVAGTWLGGRGTKDSSHFTKSNGTLWTFGNNNKGQLATGNTTDYSSPKQVGALTDWGPIHFGCDSTCFNIKTDGTLWAWGADTGGCLGNAGATGGVSSPIQVGVADNWLRGGSCEANNLTSTAAIKTDGTLWTWGSGGYGVLGDGARSNNTVPTKVGSLRDWNWVDVGAWHMVATKTDGTLWTWGHGANGALGLGNTTSYSSPKQVGTDTDWKYPAAWGGLLTDQHSGAVKTDGTLWTWGNGTVEGNLGHGNTTDYSSPKQVGALTTWGFPRTNGNNIQVRKTDGTIWSWGQGGSGMLGLNNSTDYSSPKKIGALTTWDNIQGGGGATHMWALK